MEDIVAMARAAEKDERLSDGALYGKLANEIERLRRCHRIVAKQVAFYKPELPDFTKVDIYLGILRAAERCAGKAPWETDQSPT